jgi:hypothetical protein
MFQLSENDPDTEVHARAKARNQRTFTLVEQDMTSVEVIAYWILKNIHTAPAQKLHDAVEICLEMREFGAVKHAD